MCVYIYLFLVVASDLRNYILPKNSHNMFKLTQANKKTQHSQNGAHVTTAAL